MSRTLARLLLSGVLTATLFIATLASFAPLSTNASGSGASGVGTTNAEPLSARGKALFLAKGCIACHALSVPGDPAFSRRLDVQVAPPLTGIATIAATRRPGQPAADYLRESIVSPQSFITPGYATTPNNPGRPQMPTLPLTADEADALVAFLLDPR